MRDNFLIIDISQPVNSKTACFPGDVPFSREVTVSYQDSQVINLCAMTLSPHVGTHADAPVHVRGDMTDSHESIGQVGLSPFVGPCWVVDVSPASRAIQPDDIAEKLYQLGACPPRILFKTRTTLRYDVFEADYAWFSPELIDYLAGKGVQLVGLDTPSVDAVDSKTLETHHCLLKHGMTWLENLDLSSAQEGQFFLVALPLKLTEMEASPVRAVLLDGL